MGPAVAAPMRPRRDLEADEPARPRGRHGPARSAASEVARRRAEHGLRFVGSASVAHDEPLEGLRARRPGAGARAEGRHLPQDAVRMSSTTRSTTVRR